MVAIDETRQAACMKAMTHTAAATHSMMVATVRWLSWICSTAPNTRNIWLLNTTLWKLSSLRQTDSQLLIALRTAYYL